MRYLYFIALISSLTVLKHENLKPYFKKNPGVEKKSLYDSMVPTEDEFKLTDLKKYFSDEIVAKYFQNKTKNPESHEIGKKEFSLLHVKDIIKMKLMELQHKNHREMMEMLSGTLEKLSDAISSAMRDHAKIMRDVIAVVSTWDDIKDRLKKSAEEDESCWPTDYLDDEFVEVIN